MTTQPAPLLKGKCIQRVCRECGKTFYVTRAALAQGRGLSCSRECGAKSQNRIRRENGIKRRYGAPRSKAGDPVLCRKAVGSPECRSCGKPVLSQRQECGPRQRALVPDQDWFWSRVDKSGGPDACWPFTGSRNEDGYGTQQWEGKVHKASRLALLFTEGESEGRPFSCHKCDNPPCCNPKHLYWGTPSDNMKDAWARGRKRRAS